MLNGNQIAFEMISANGCFSSENLHKLIHIVQVLEFLFRTALGKNTKKDFVNLILLTTLRLIAI